MKERRALPVCHALALQHLLAAGLHGTAAQYVGCAMVDADGHAEIPYGVTSIKADSFKGCVSLVSISIPSSVTSIGPASFWGCTSLACVTIPASVTSIGADDFWGCASLSSVAFRSSTTDVHATAFDSRFTAFCGGPPQDCDEDCADGHRSGGTVDRRLLYYWGATAALLGWYCGNQLLPFAIRSTPTGQVADDNDWQEFVRMRNPDVAPVRVIVAAAFASASSSSAASVVATLPTVTVSAVPVDEMANDGAAVCVIAAAAPTE